MQVYQSAPDAVGKTPLIKLRKVSEQTGCDIYGKAEFMNPGQSVKDRAALSIIRDAERRGDLQPGGLIVEGTAGNTGIGLAVIGRALGYDTIIVIPETQSEEKKAAIRLAGAQLVEVPSGTLSQSEQLHPLLHAPGAEAERDASDRRDLGQSIRQHRQSGGALRNNRP